jgi:hypothetical protein
VQFSLLSRGEALFQGDAVSGCEIRIFLRVVAGDHKRFLTFANQIEILSGLHEQQRGSGLTGAGGIRSDGGVRDWARQTPATKGLLLHFCSRLVGMAQVVIPASPTPKRVT